MVKFFELKDVEDAGWLVGAGEGDAGGDVEGGVNGDLDAGEVIGGEDPLMEGAAFGLDTGVGGISSEEGEESIIGGPQHTGE